MRTNIIVVLLFVIIPFIGIYVIMDLRQDRFPVGTIGYLLIGIIGIAVTLFFSRRLERKKEKKEQVELQQ